MDEQDYTGVLNSDGAHTDEYAFCTDMDCFCHEDPGETANVGDYVTDGLLTVNEADQYYRGKTI